MNEQTAARLEGYIAFFEGINYEDWSKLKIGIDKSFDQMKREAERQLSLSSPYSVMTAIRSQFG